MRNTIECCDNCKNQQRCADKQAGGILDDFLSASRWLDWTTYGCDDFKRKIPIPPNNKLLGILGGIL